MTDPVVAVAREAGADGPEILEQALALSGFRDRALDLIQAALERRGACSAVVVPALDAFTRTSPAATDPRLVEHLLDVLFDLGVTEAVVGSTRGGGALWLENRDVFMAADLLGYRYETEAGRPYDVVDLAEEVDEGVFAPGSPLEGVGVPRAWLDADLRIVFSANRTDEDDGYALCLSTLLSLLPATDKDYHYRYRRDAGEVLSALTTAAPAHFALIDAVVSGHGGGGARAPREIRTDTVILATNPALADYVGALKMGMDPFVSTLAAPSLRQARPTSRTRIIGSLDAYPDWINVDPALRASTAARRTAVAADRSVRPILQQVDREIFPFRDPVNDWLNKALSDVAAAADGAPGGGLLTLLNLWLAEMGKAGEAWAVLFDKDSLRRREAAINIDPSGVSESDYEAVEAELASLGELLRGVVPDADGMRWRLDDRAVLFDGARRIPLPFEHFTEAVEISRTIQFMNDYIGGQALVTARDDLGRAIRQIERNLYLPQPNYTALGGGIVIDVTKIETVRYEPRRQTMFWKTVRSENESAIADDGVVTFEALGEDTLITIVGRQHFRLPPYWAAIDESLTPEMKGALVADAYGRFFQRTFANLEATAEGRDVRIGRDWAVSPEGEPLPVERLAGLGRRLQAGGDLDISGLIKGVMNPRRDGQPSPVRIDEDGFHHFDGSALGPPPTAKAVSAARLILRDLTHAARADTGGGG